MSVRVAGPGRGTQSQDHKSLGNSEPPTARTNLKRPRSALAACPCSDLTPTGMRKKSTGGLAARMTLLSWKKVRDGGVQGDCGFQEAEKRQGLLWDAVELRGGQVSLRPACQGCFLNAGALTLKQ